MSEVRTGKRFPLQLPITIELPKSAKRLKGTTSNVSAAGVYIRSDGQFEVGSRVEFDITLPAEVIGTQRNVEIRCRGRVVRAEGAADGKAKSKNARKAGSGLACVIDHYRFIRR